MLRRIQSISSSVPIRVMRQLERDTCHILLDFSLTVKAATLIFISGCGSAISSAMEGKSSCYRVNKLFEPRKRACIS